MEDIKIRSIQIGETTYSITTNDLAAIEATIGTPAVEETAYTKAQAATGLMLTSEKVETLSTLLSIKAKNHNVELSTNGAKQIDEDTKEETDVPASISLISQYEDASENVHMGKVSVKADLHTEGDFVVPVEISKKGKVTIAGETAENKLDSKSTINTLCNYIASNKSIKVVLTKNNLVAESEMAAKDVTPTAYQIAYDKDQKFNTELSGLSGEYTEGYVFAEVSLYDLIGLVDRVKTLEDKVAALEKA